MSNNKKVNPELLNLTIKERALRERDSGEFEDAVEYWTVPDYRYPRLHIDMANDPTIAVDGDLRSMEEREQDFFFGKTKADLLLFWQNWKKVDTGEMQYEYTGDKDGFFDRAEMFLVRNEKKNNQPELIVAFYGINGVNFFSFDVGTVVAMLQKLRECDAEEPLNLRGVY